MRCTACCDSCRKLGGSAVADYQYHVDGDALRKALRDILDAKTSMARAVARANALLKRKEAVERAAGVLYKNEARHGR